VWIVLGSSGLLHDWCFTANQSWGQAPETHDQQLFQLYTCGYSPHVTSSLTTGWVCSLQLLLVLASAVILGFEYRGTRDHILLSQIQDSTAWRARSPYLYPPGTGWPRHRVPFPSPPTTRWAMVEVFDPASIRESWKPSHSNSS
jgi:hypothetical protein